MNDILASFAGMYGGGAGAAAGMAMSTFAIIAAIDFIWKVLKTLMSEENQITLLVQCSIKYGMISALIMNYIAWSRLFLQSLMDAGLAVGGGGIGSGALTNPDYIWQTGAINAQPLLEVVKGTASLGAIPVALMCLVMYVILMACYLLIACQVFITWLEWYIIGGCAVIFFPFLANDNTKFMGEKAIGAIVAQGVKLMVLGVVLSAIMPVLGSLALPAKADVSQCILPLGKIAAMAFLAWHAPGVAAGLLAGSPSLSFDNVRSAGASGAGMVSRPGSGGSGGRRVPTTIPDGIKKATGG